MDVKCPICGEPWDTDELHDVAAKTYKQAYAEFRKIGCEVFGGKHSGNKANLAVGALMDVLGDDVDGMAATLEDFNL